ncbi:ATP-grasp domain-containing protein [Bacillus sp. FJAT-42315]|uniref:ATP-grasp domain-containing protein n=1 Tax=Bacillus sp. FJAT-42315 TaxID=2014077 RepID=UPI000C23BC30|nr:ATP-grasp domain-containing protein [Bacillus sp. FJAT-42315]
MIILDKPYVSHLLSSSIKDLQIPVIKVNDVEIPNEDELFLTEKELFLQEFSSSETPILFNSENGLFMLNEYLPDHQLTSLAATLKNKAEFRRTLTTHFPEFFFRELSFAELDTLDINTLPFPIIIKPVVGYSSIGVYRIDQKEDFIDSINKLKQDMSMAGSAYPKEVIDSQTLIIEELIEGDEYAVDVYYTEEGKPVVLNLFKRMFSHEKDMSDRIYFTSKQVLKEALRKVEIFLENIGPIFGLQSAPIHIEVRMNSQGIIVPIEANPLRFAGIGTTELGVHAYGVNVYEYYFKQLAPDWESIMNEMDDSIYSFCCAEVDPSIDCKAIGAVDHEAFKSNFEEILEYRPMAFNEYSTFAVVFHKAPDFEENKRILQLDLNDFLTMRELQLV